MSEPVLSRYLRPDVLGRIARQRFQPRGRVLGKLSGAHKSPVHGFAVEFVGHRPYVWGDDPKHIDWRVYFTRERYFVKQYEMETNLVCHLVLDASASMRYGEGAEQKLLYASQMAVTLGYAVLERSDKVSLATFDSRLVGFVPPSNSLAQVLRMSQHLSELGPAQKTRMADALLELLERLGRREVVVIFSDFFTDLDELEESLQRLRYHRHEVVLFQVLHHDEIAFELEGMVRFQGLEEPGEHRTQPEEVRASYLEAFERFQSRFDALCHRNRVERVVVDTSRDMADVFVDYLEQRRRHRRKM